MSIDQILDEIDDMIEGAMRFPLSSGKSLIDAGKLSACIDDVRLNLPGEIKQAKLIVSDRAEILDSAKREAEQIVRKAEERAKQLIAQEEILKQAQAKAAEIISQAQAKAKEMRYAAQDFSDSLLKQTEEVLTESLKDVRATRQGLRQLHNRRTGGSQSGGND